MPKSKKRAKVVARGKSAASYSQWESGTPVFVESPWQTWLHVSAIPGIDAEKLRFIEHLPFRMGDDGWASLSSMAKDTGQTVAETVESLGRMESLSFLSWSTREHVAILSVPADDAG